MFGYKNNNNNNNLILLFDYCLLGNPFEVIYISHCILTLLFLRAHHLFSSKYVLILSMRFDLMVKSWMGHRKKSSSNLHENKIL